MLDVKTAFSVVSREESKQKHGFVSVSSSKGQTSAFVGKINDSKRFKGKKNQNLLCKNCGLKGHTIEKYYRNQTWIITILPPGRKPIGCKWLYKIKYK